MHDLVVGKWGARFLGRQFACSVGRGGVSSEKHEGDGVTPAGEWRILGGGWRADRIRRPVTTLPLTPLGPRDVWSDDPAHGAYNQLAHELHPPFSHERMRRGDGLYDIVLYSDWNCVPTVPGKGSAIFVHCWKATRRPTAGCVAFRRSDLLWITQWWQRNTRVIVKD